MTPQLPPAPSAEFQRFRERVLEDPALFERLRQSATVPDLKRAVVTAGHELGFAFSEADVQAALDQSRRSYIERALRL